MTILQEIDLPCNLIVKQSNTCLYFLSFHLNGLNSQTLLEYDVKALFIFPNSVTTFLNCFEIISRIIF